MSDRLDGSGHGIEMEPRIEIGLSTDVGQVRTGNEDSVLCEPLESARVSERGLFCAVADGMGGHAAGEVASSMAVATSRERFYGSADGDVAEALRTAIIEANTAVYDAGAGTTGRDHMGSTITAAVLSKDEVIVGHVGDTRCYIVRRGAISQLTNDHSWVAEEVKAGLLTEEQARVHPRRNIITRALGLRPEVEVDVYRATLEVGNLIVICSDGLHGLVTDEEILSHVTRHRPAAAVETLVRLANERGGPDNISVLVAQVVEDEADTQPGFMAIADTPTPMATPIPASLLDPSSPPPGTPLAEAPVEAASPAFDDPTTTPTSIPLPELVPEEVNTSPAAPAPSQELALDDDSTDQAPALGLHRPEEAEADPAVQSQSQSQSQTPSPFVPLEEEDDSIGPTTERRRVLDHLPTSAPRSVPEPADPGDSDFATEPGLVADPRLAAEPAPAEPAPVEPRSMAPRRAELSERRPSRASGIGLIVVLLLLLVLGAGIGVLLFRLSGLTPGG